MQIRRGENYRNFFKMAKPRIMAGFNIRSFKPEVSVMLHVMSLIILGTYIVSVGLIYNLFRVMSPNNGLYAWLSAIALFVIASLLLHAYVKWLNHYIFNQYHVEAKHE
ncbi:hypothetical protein [Staphylococcus capitis]|uniref:hypothetical protein n=1 Tax=Staphylococcus capitis TaxID=29388 RepID=UPI00203EBA97|nr:hypothetical protein [Staphylococcus capitis]